MKTDDYNRLGKKVVNSPLSKKSSESSMGLFATLFKTSLTYWCICSGVSMSVTVPSPTSTSNAVYAASISSWYKVIVSLILIELLSDSTKGLVSESATMTICLMMRECWGIMVLRYSIEGQMASTNADLEGKRRVLGS